MPPPEIQFSTFKNWEEVGRWYKNLQQERAIPTEEVRAKAIELTKSLTDESAKIHAIYDYVSVSFHYVGVAFGIGRYQPHSAAEVLNNKYGDCKDKHTLLASMLWAVGIKAYPALINSAHELDPDVPSPAQFDHVISVVARKDSLEWLDTTPEVAPFAYLMSFLGGKQALVITDDKPPGFMRTPADPTPKAQLVLPAKALSANNVPHCGKSPAPLLPSRHHPQHHKPTARRRGPKPAPRCLLRA